MTFDQKLHQMEFFIVELTQRNNSIWKLRYGRRAYICTLCQNPRKDGAFRLSGFVWGLLTKKKNVRHEKDEGWRIITYASLYCSW